VIVRIRLSKVTGSIGCKIGGAVRGLMVDAVLEPDGSPGESNFAQTWEVGTTLTGGAGDRKAVRGGIRVLILKTGLGGALGMANLWKEEVKDICGGAGLCAKPSGINRRLFATRLSLADMLCLHLLCTYLYGHATVTT
jgi:hypothetical protein